MTDPTTTPTPTNEQQDARERVRHTDDFDACPVCSPPVRETVGMVCQGCGTDYAKDDARTIAWNTWIDDVGRHMGSRTRDLMSAFDAGWAARDVQPNPLAAVSAAAPDERATDPLIVSAIRRHPSGTLRYEPANGPATGTSERSFLAEYDAALAARPAPVVNAEPLRVEYGLVWDDRGSADVFPTLEQARAAARGLDEPAQVVRIETWPVADEGCAEDRIEREGGEE